MSTKEELRVYLERVSTQETEKYVQFGTHSVKVRAGVNGLMNIEPEIKDLAGFHGSTRVHQVVEFGQLFTRLLDNDGTDFGEWSTNPDVLAEKGIYILEYMYPRVREILQQIDTLAGQFIEDPSEYDNHEFTQSYFDLVNLAYSYVRKFMKEMGIDPGLILSLERGGLIATRSFLGVDKNSKVPGELRVVTKRFHRKDENHGDISVSALWRDLSMLMAMHARNITVPDIVNPATGASTLAALIAAQEVYRVKPKSVNICSVSSTVQGNLAMRYFLSSLGIRPVIISAGVSRTMDSHYYLNQRGRRVADAGDATSRFLPNWYQQ